MPNNLSGENAAVVPASARDPAAGVPRFHRLTVADVRRESADAVSIAFLVPKHLSSAYTFTPGQYLTLRATINGAEARRSYSICSGPDDGELRVAVKCVEGGLFSPWVMAKLSVGDEIDVMTPTGRFGLAGFPGDGRIHVAFAAGSGITPVLSILRGVLAREPASRFFLIYGNRSTGDILFRSNLEDLKDRFLERLSVFHVLSREEQDISVLNGRLDGVKARILLSTLVPAESIDHAFVCGPDSMSEEITDTLKSLGFPDHRIHVERFVSALGGRPRPASKAASAAAPAHTAVIIIDGKRREISVADGEAILDAALHAGMDLPFACRGGMCCSCRARLLEGTAQMEVNYSLETWEQEAGFVLTCQARPTSKHVVVDFDQR